MKTNPSYFFRLCHVCFSLNEANDEILECVACEQPFTPDVDEDEEWEATLDQMMVEPSAGGEDSPRFKYLRLRRLAGLSVRW